jgi:hypothetical protein
VSPSVPVSGEVSYAQTTHTGGEHGIGEAMSGVLSAAVAPPGPAAGVTPLGGPQAPPAEIRLTPPGATVTV